MKWLRGQKVSQIDIADDFYFAYQRCLASDHGRIYAIPGFVNGLFACELYLKTVVNNWSDCLKGKDRHNLRQLFLLLDEKDQNKLRNIENDSDCGLNKMLEAIGDGFTVWRYLYEDGNEDFGGNFPFQITESFLKKYLPAIRELAHDKANSVSEEASEMVQNNQS